MTKLLDRAIEATKDLPAEMQDELARIMLSFVNDGQDIYVLSPEEQTDIEESIAEVERGELTTEEEVRTTLMKYRL